MNASKSKDSFFGDFFSTLMQHPFLALVLLVMPFSNSGVLSQNILGITGMKPFNLLAILMVGFWVMKGGRVLSFKDKIDKKATMLFYCYIVVFGIQFVRSFLNYDVLLIRLGGEFASSSLGYLLSYGVKSLLLTLSFVYICQLIRSKKQLHGVIAILTVSILVFSCVSMMLSFGIQTSGLQRNSVAKVFMDNLGLHYNNVATIIMLGIPLVFGISMELGKRYFWILIFLTAALISAGSRGAISSAALGTMFVFFLTFANSNSNSKIKTFVIIVSCFVLVAMSSGAIITFISGGEAEASFAEASNGRWDLMWLPLFSELIQKPLAMIFGYGMFGMVQSDSYIYVRDFYQATHAHNAYLNLLVDAGLIVLLPFVITCIVLFKKALRYGKHIKSPIFYGLLGSFIAFMIASLSGRQFLPNLDNMMLFPVVALIICYVRLISLKRKEEMYEYS